MATNEECKVKAIAEFLEMNFEFKGDNSLKPLYPSRYEVSAKHILELIEEIEVLETLRTEKDSFAQFYSDFLVLKRKK